MKLWDLNTGQALRTFSGHSRGLACVHWAPSGDYFVSGSNDKTIKLWDANTGECLQTFTGHGDLVRSLWYDEKTQRVVSASYDRTTRVWDAATGKLIQRYRSHASLVFDVAFDASRIVRFVCFPYFLLRILLISLVRRSCSHDQRILVMDFGEGLDVSKFA
jgi:WD40 repeat protein